MKLWLGRGGRGGQTSEERRISNVIEIIYNSQSTKCIVIVYCVLSPLLYILYTDNCRSSHDDRFLVKFADDSALISLFTGPENNHGDVLKDFIDWCDDSYLELNVQKTKELIVDFRKKNEDVPSTIIHGQEVDIVSKYKYLGTIFDDKLRWDENTDLVIKKCHQRLYFLRKLKSFSVDTTILSLFYQSFIESVLCFSFISWYFNLSIKNKNSLKRIVSLGSKIIGEPQRDLTQFCEQQILRKGKSIIASDSHILKHMFQYLPSGRRFRLPSCKTNRRKFSFVPVATRLLNG